MAAARAHLLRRPIGFAREGRLSSGQAVAHFSAALGDDRRDAVDARLVTDVARALRAWQASTERPAATKVLREAVRFFWQNPRLKRPVVSGKYPRSARRRYARGRRCRPPRARLLRCRRRSKTDPLPARAEASGGHSTLGSIIGIEARRKGLVGVEQWAELRREHFVRGVSIKELARRTGLIAQHDPGARCDRSSRRAIERAPAGVEARSVQGRDPPPAAATSPKLPGQRVRELIAPLGFDGGKTIVDDYLREVRPLFVHAPDLSAHDLSARGDLPVRPLGAAGRDPGRPRPDPQGVGRRRVLGLLARGRRRADLLQADAGPAGRHPALPVVAGRAAARRWSGIARPGCTPAAAGRPSEFAAFCGALRVGWHFCERADPQAKGVVERLQEFLETQLRAGPRVRQRAGLPAAARHLVRQARESADAQDAALPADRPPRRGARR